MSEPILMTLRDAAESHGVSYTALWTAVQNGELPAEKARSRWRVEPAAVRQWLREADDYETNGVAS